MKVPSAEGSRFKIIVENPEEQAVMVRIKSWHDAGDTIPDIAGRLNDEGVPSPRGTKSVEPFRRPSVSRPAQVQQLLDGRFDPYYGARGG